jgi:hypothetical protein
MRPANIIFRYLHFSPDILASPLVCNPLFSFRVSGFYFFLRTSNAIRNIPWSSLRSDFVSWSLIDVLSIAMVIGVQVTYQSLFIIWWMDPTENQADNPWIRALAAITTGLLWLKAVSFLKMGNMHLATFVFALVEVRKSIAAFHVASNHKISYSRSFPFNAGQ